MSSVIRRLIAGTEWSELFQLASPRLFEVMPVGGMVGQAYGLARNATDRRGGARAREARRDALLAAGLPVTLGEARPHRAPSTGGDAERADPPVLGGASVGQVVLKLYFHQIADGRPVFLDLRSARFSADSEGYHWAPGRLFVRWPTDFQEALWGLYSGFYDDDETRFVAGLRALGIEVAEDLFRKHFGADPSAVDFELDQFRQSFLAIFTRCRDRGATLHPSFVTLGLYLLTLYEHLEGLAVPQDVRRAFTEVQRTVEAASARR